MNDPKPQTTFESYLRAFSEPSPVDQERLLRESVSEDVAFAILVSMGVVSGTSSNTSVFFRRSPLAATSG